VGGSVPASKPNAREVGAAEKPQGLSPARPSENKLQANIEPKVAAKAPTKAIVLQPATAPKVTLGGAEAQIFEYMRTQNRPYNATAVFENLHKTIAKSMIEKCLEGLVAKEQLIGKAYGKQKIYWVNQAVFETPDHNALQAMNDERERKAEELNSLKKSNAAADAAVKTLESELDDEALSSRLLELESQTAALREKLHKFEGEGQCITPQEREKIVQNYSKMRKEWKSRKRACTDGISTMCESMEKKPKELMEKMGIETDEDWNALLGPDKVTVTALKRKR